jgi:peptidoglycan/xylan/chitin deacetylase (PgdA/CDA1 family)
MHRSLRNILKNGCYTALSRSGLTALHRSSIRSELIVLTYHSFYKADAPAPIDRQNIDLLRRQVRHLMEAYTIVPLEEGLAEVLSAQPVSQRKRPRLAITIDDGYADTYQLAYPLLRSFGVPATVFVTTDFIDTGRPPWTIRLREILRRTRRTTTRWPKCLDLSNLRSRAAAEATLMALWADLEPEERFESLRRFDRELEVSDQTLCAGLSWDHLREMARCGFGIGSHTVFHSILTRIDHQSLVMELSKSRERLEAELGCECRIVAYPNGEVSSAVAKAAGDAGYVYGLTQRLEAICYGSDALALGRVQVPHDEGMAVFASRVSLLAASIARLRLYAPFAS